MMLQVSHTQVDHNTWTLVRLKKNVCLNLPNLLRKIESCENGKYAHIPAGGSHSFSKVYFEKSKDAFTFKIMNLDLCYG